jgi:fused signal recognition particle receptor
LSEQLGRIEQGVRQSKKAWFSKIAHIFDRGSLGKEIWDELEESLISADVGVETTNKLIDRVKQRVIVDKLTQALQVKSALKAEMINLLDIPPKPINADSAFQVILVVGVNGSGKTTSIAKLAYSFTSQGKKVILAAGDTFRAAAIDQLRYWGEKTGAAIIAHQPGSDPGAVVFDAIQAAHSRHAQAVIIDTAGRLHTKFNLMEELKKIKKVAAKLDPTAPHQVLLVLDATTGQNGLTQAKYFTEAVGITGIFLAKLDSTAKGGIIFAICHELNIPIVYIGTGEKLEDMAPFNAETFINAILY